MYRVRSFILPGGERLPLILNNEKGPLIRPLLWLLTMRRARNLGTNTLISNMYSLKALYLWANRQGIDIEEKGISRRYLDPHEQSSLADFCKQHIGSLGKAHAVRTLHRQTVCTNTHANRLRIIAEYIKWLSTEGAAGGQPDSDGEYQRRERMVNGLTARMPKIGTKSIVGKREAPPPGVIEHLISMIQPDAVGNPWDDLGLRHRNQLIIHLYYSLGIRRGEALQLKTHHIDLRQRRILIARAADDPEDPRTNQPLTKTRDRWLPIGSGLSEMIQNYIIHVRSKIPGAKRHSFLIVSHQTGAPLALTSVNKVFRNLRSRVSKLPHNLSPHLLRHAWNDAFSRLVDAKEISPEREMQMRSEIMGWSPTSGTAATYTRRHVRRSAEALSLSHQEQLARKNADVAAKD